MALLKAGEEVPPEVCLKFVGRPIIDLSMTRLRGEDGRDGYCCGWSWGDCISLTGLLGRLSPVNPVKELVELLRLRPKGLAPKKIARAFLVGLLGEEGVKGTELFVGLGGRDDVANGDEALVGLGGLEVTNGDEAFVGLVG